MTSLRSLGVAIAANDLALFLELRDIVQSCPGITDLAIYAVAQPIEATGRFHRHTVTSWPWGDLPVERSFGFTHVKKLELRNICICHKYTASWVQIVPWSELRRLYISCPSFLLRLAGHLRN